MLNDVYGSSGDVNLESSGQYTVERGQTPSPPPSYREENVMIFSLKFNKQVRLLTFTMRWSDFIRQFEIEFQC